MSVINKELYDALRQANVSDELATAASRSDSEVKQDIAGMKVSVAKIEARLSIAEKLQWAILLGVIGIVIKTFFS